MKKSFLSRITLWMLVVTILAWACNNEEKNSETITSDSLEVSKAGTDHTNMDMGTDTATQPMADHAEAELSGTSSDTAVSGTVKFENASNGKVRMMLDITVAAKAGKSVAVHIHEHGDCSDSGKMAHGHWNPTNTEHGKWGSGSFHSGDIGNVKLDSKGKGTLNLETDLWTIGGKHDKNILNKAIIVHGGVDDFKTQPTGDAGSRIGCGVIK